MKQFYIYRTHNLLDDKYYIGQHYGEVNDSYYGSGTIITKALNKYGKENFTKEILEICEDAEQLNEREKYWIAYYNAVQDTNYYNIAEGGSNREIYKVAQQWAQEHPEEALAIYQQNGERLKQWSEDQRENNYNEWYDTIIKPLTAGAQRWREEHPNEVQNNMDELQNHLAQWRNEHQEEYQKQVDEWRTAGSKANSQKIRCITTGEVFASMSEASRAYKQYKVQQANLTKYFKGERKSCGMKDGVPLQWEKI